MDRLTSTFGSIPARFQAWWSSQSPTGRIVAGALLAVLVVGLGIFGLVRAKGPEYGVLFANLPADEANAVVQKLDAQKIPHRLVQDNGGTTIMVPATNLYEERVALAGEGVVKAAGGGTGFELFDKTNLGMTDFQEKIAKVRATEGELQRTIASLTPVQSARVHIAVPEASLYSSSQQPTTTSIAVQTKPGMALTSDEVRGITALAAGAIEGLKPENVTIVDQSGTILRPAPGDDTALAQAASALKLTQDQLAAKERFENDLQQSIQGMLDQTIGAKRSAVRVSSTMNFDANSTETKSYAPQGTVRSEQTEKESYSGAGPPPRTAAGGVPGTTTNVVPTYQAANQQNGNQRYNKSKATRNYEITSSNVKHVDAPGKLEKLGVAVLVNVPAAGGAPGAPADAQYAVSAADVAKIRNVVAAAAGLDVARGDQISVEAIPFAPAPPTALIAGRGANVLGVPVVPLVAVLAIVALAGAGAGFMLLRRRGAGGFRPMTEMPTFDSTLAEELPSFEEHPMLDGTPAIAAPIRSAADLTREQMIEYVTTVAQENPDSIAKLVKLWLAE